MTRIAWLDCSSGISGDMLLGALTDLGRLDDLADIAAAVPGATVTTDVVRRDGQRAVSVAVRAAADQPERHLDEVRAIIELLGVEATVTAHALTVFERLAEAEATVHGTTRDDVHFHEVGAVDSIIDIVGACLGLHRLAIDELVVSPIALGGGSAQTRHGQISIPGPAVLQLLKNSPLFSHGGPVESELATPTGVALATHWATSSGAMPPLAVEGIGVGAGGREIEGHANLLRLVVGQPATSTAGDEWSLLEANIDDLDPRLWPAVIDALIAGGAADAWLTPILMKKGRPAHTLHALVSAATRDTVSRLIFANTSTLGLRSMPVDKQALDREWRSVDIDGQPIRVKLALLDGLVLTATPEWVDVQAAAVATGQPVRAVLRAATASAEVFIGTPGQP